MNPRRAPRATDQYVRFRGPFLAAPFGVGPAVRDYPRGVDGAGDTGSGPLLLGVSLSATVVTLGEGWWLGLAALRRRRS
ncbi:hypothetical protein Ari01nite_06390 [Paractinoplanes rishiriensis]|uniref:Uncharacterized protein n=1 Tax=Paractinoplanes rishiriensis TaxID=1050105 RepID=A0A919MSG4_9ACTN|nr:hypothetical protein Ari01nite_06390 [Actinoplanes rishiriensis]